VGIGTRYRVPALSGTPPPLLSSRATRRWGTPPTRHTHARWIGDLWTDRKCQGGKSSRPPPPSCKRSFWPVLTWSKSKGLLILHYCSAGTHPLIHSFTHTTMTPKNVRIWIWALFVCGPWIAFSTTNAFSVVSFSASRISRRLTSPVHVPKVSRLYQAAASLSGEEINQRLQQTLARLREKDRQSKALQPSVSCILIARCFRLETSVHTLPHSSLCMFPCLAGSQNCTRRRTHYCRG